MKKYCYLLIALLSFVGCRYDDTEIWNEVNKQAQAIEKLQTLCNQMNTNIIALQTMVAALEDSDFVTSVAPITRDGVEVGYVITFSKSGPVTIYHGKDGADGKDGQNGADGKDGKDGVDGKDGSSPVIGIRQDNDGNYYWTLNGEWLLDANSDKIRAQGKDGADGKDGQDGADGKDGQDGKDGVDGTDGKDGKDGQDGKDGKDGRDGITPQLKVENGFWCISYDGGANWIRLYKAVTDSSDSLFHSVVDEGGYVRITLNDGTELVFKKVLDNAKLLSLSFKAVQNAAVLISDLKAEIGENVVECLIPYVVSNKKLTPVFEIYGDAVYVGDQLIESGQTQLDFSKPVTFTVVGNKVESVSYTVNVRAFNGIPVILINTASGATITTRDAYYNATIKIIEDINTRAAGDVFESDVKIKGRGNTTWYLPKKPYKLKFNEKVSLFGEAKDKEWVLLANAMDLSMLRTEVAMYMGKRSLLSYTTSCHFADLFLNGEYMGTYQVAEQQKISEHRVNVTDNGYLLEIDSKAAADDITFTISSIPQPINIKDPDVAVNSDAYNYIVGFMQQVESVLFGENWLDPYTGWQSYMDMDSFVDWYLINEISRNNDAVFFTSCFMHHAPGGKLCMGPLWDYDLAFGNYKGANSQPEGFYIKDNIGWYIRLFADPAFKARVKERFAYFYSIKEDILNEINVAANYIEKSAIENHNKWSVLYEIPYYGTAAYGAYYNEISLMKQWIIDRMEWLKGAYEQL